MPARWGALPAAELPGASTRQMRESTVTETEAAAHGPERPRQTGVVVLFTRAPVWPVPVPLFASALVGRGDSAQLQLDDKGVSWEHALLEPVPGGVVVSDNGSRNGTHVNGQLVTEPRTFAGFGSLIRLGGSLLTVSDDVLAYEYHEGRSRPGLVGGPALDGVRARIDLVAGTRDPVLVEGETGTGKEVVARAIHHASGRRGELVAINCGAIAPELVESELFGHVKGAFSGATGTRRGVFRSADGGTLLLDEIGEMPLALQVRLLRVVETGRVRAVGDDREVPVDARVVAATNRDLEQCVAAGTFRGDLLHRITTARIELPPLRQRREDIPMLAGHFLAERHTGINAAAVEVLMAHAWPGNVRELANVLRGAANAATHAGRDTIQPDDLPQLSAAPRDDLRSRVLEALTATGGNMTRAAKRIGMARSVLYETVKRLQVDPKSFRR